MKLPLLTVSTLALVSCATSVPQQTTVVDINTKPPFVKPVTQVAFKADEQAVFVVAPGKAFVFGEGQSTVQQQTPSEVSLRRLPRSADVTPKSSSLEKENRSENANPIALERSEIGVHFNFDSSELNQSARKQLLSHIDELKVASEIALHGHTDDTGGANYNLVLSLKRAESVKQFLQASGVKGSFSLHGFGSKVPISDNRTSAGRAKNRRVIVIY